MNFIKNLKIVRKIQLGFLIFGMISTVIVISNYISINKMSKSKNALYSKFIEPKDKIDELYSEYQKIQFVMLKFSIAEFASDFGNNIKQYNNHKEIVDSLLNSFQTEESNSETFSNLAEIKEIWANYKNIVADAIISAAASGSYDMAAVIATTSGEEVGQKLVSNLEKILTQLRLNSNDLDREFSNAEKRAITYLIIGVITGTITLLLSIFLLAPKISNPIKEIVAILNEFALGNYDIDIEDRGEGEFSSLMNTAKKFQQAQIEKINAAEKIAEGELVRVNEASDKDKLAHAFNTEVNILEDLLKELDKLIEANEKGDLTTKLDISKFSGSWASILEGLNKLRSTTLAPIEEARKILSLMASGDFTTKMVGNYKGDYKHIKDDINKVSDSLNKIIGEVKLNAEELASSALQISSRTIEMAAGAGEQSSQTQEVVAAIEAITNTINESTNNATIAVSTAQEAGDKARAGGEVVEETIEGINRIADIVIKSAKTIEELGSSSDQIGEIIQVINEIADQTNLLALNAAIEAARAGEHGRGFAVVADEVRKLAERTTGATNEIKDMIQKIQEDTSGAVESIEKGKDEVEKGKALAGDARNALGEIIANTDEVAALINELARASENQNLTSQEIRNSVELISNVTQQSTDSTQQISFAAENLNRLTENLQKVVNQFKLSNSSESSYQYNQTIIQQEEQIA
jgi:methyl-accepting chemotaxis protein